MSNYAKRMGRLSARIFGEVVRPTSVKSMRVVELFKEKPIEQQKHIVDFFPNLPNQSKLFREIRELGLFRDEHQDFREEMTRSRALRGKVKPKPGGGKRALKKKGLL